MSGLNKDYFLTLDIRTGNLTGGNIYFYNTDKLTSNIFVQLVEKKDKIMDIISNPSEISLRASIVKPGKVIKRVDSTLVDDVKAIYEFKLPLDCTNLGGEYYLEFEIKEVADNVEKCATSNFVKYEVKESILTKIGEDGIDTEDYPLFLDLVRRLETEIEGKFDEVRLNTDDTIDTHIVLDFYAKNIKVDSVAFDIDVDLTNYATKTFVSTEIAKAQLQGVDGSGIDLSGFATMDDIPTKTSQLRNDSNFLSSIPSEYITETELGTELENYSLGTHTHDDVYASKDDLKKIMDLVDTPPKYVRPSLSLSASVSNLQHNVTTSITLNPSFSQNDGGGVTKYVLNKGSIKLYENTSLGSYTDTVTLTYNSSVTYSATVTYSDGIIKNTSLGIPYPSTSIKAGSTSTSKTINCYALSYTGVISKATITASDIPSLTSRLCTSKSYTGNYSLNNQRVVYMYPSYLGTLTSIKDSNNFDYINSYTLTKMTYNDIQYNVYILTDEVTISSFKQIFN